METSNTPTMAEHLEDDIMRNSLKTTAAAFLLVTLTGLTGCATTRDLDVLKLAVEKAQALLMPPTPLLQMHSLVLMQQLHAVKPTPKNWTVCLNSL